MLSEIEILKILENCGAIIQNSHLVYTSGKHGSQYVNKDALYPHTEIISSLCKEIANRFSKDKIEAVVAPAIGGVILSQWIAHHLTQICNKEVLAVYAEKNENGFIIKRGYDQLIKNKNVLIAEDILTTGGSVKKVMEAVRMIPCKVIGISALCNRGGLTEKDFGVKLNSLITIHLESWDAKDCPLCRNNIPINTDMGKGKI